MTQAPDSHSAAPPAGFLAELAREPAASRAEPHRLEIRNPSPPDNPPHRFRLATASEPFPYDIRVFETDAAAGLLIALPGCPDALALSALAADSLPEIVDTLATRVHCLLFFDRRRARLVALQGLFSRIPLVFYRGDDRVVVSTDPDWLCRREALARRPDRDRLIRFLRKSFDRGRRDFIAGLRRIRHGEGLRWRTDLEADSHRWQPADPPPPPSRRSGELRRRLLDSLDRRLDDSTVLSLSGGFDSCTLAGLATTHRGGGDTGPLPTASMVAPHLEALDLDDRLDWLGEQFPLDNRRFHVGGAWPLRDATFYESRLATGPTWHPGEFRGTFFYRWIRRRLGADTVVTGSGLETLFQSTPSRVLRQLARRPAAPDSWRRLARLARRQGVSSLQLLRQMARHTLRDTLGDSLPLSWLRRLRLASRPTPWRRPDAWVRPPDRDPLEDAPGSTAGQPTDGRLEFLHSWGWELSARGMFRRSVRSDTTMLLPYLDTDLGEFALAIPPEDLIAAGDAKGLFVDAVCDAVPALADTRETTGYFDQLVQQSLAGHRRRFITDLFESPYLADLGLIDPPAFRRAFDAYCRAVWWRGNLRPVGSFSIWATIAAELWLRALDGG